MIKELHLQNFRGFEDHRVPFRATTIVVGKNNAGKSTIVEALRLVSLITNRYQRLPFGPVPSWLNIPKREKGVSPSLQSIEINLESIFHRYSDPPGIITCTFTEGQAITIYIGPHGEIHALLKDKSGNSLTTPGQASSINVPKVQILPQVSPLQESEQVLNESYVKRWMATTRSSLHFRNQLKLFYEHFREFKKLAESTWPGLQVKSLDGRHLLPGDNKISLMIRDGDFTAEVGWMGHGLQMWLQTMWFLTYSSDADVIILDEPDVYMHADLQRRLIRFLKAKNWQQIVATHSMEIMAEVEPDEVLVIDRSKNKSTFTPSLPAVQKLMTHIGSVHNIQLARLWSSRVLLLVEGEDVALLKRFQNQVFPLSDIPFESIPNMSIGGWGGWQLVMGSSFFLKNAGGENIETYCLLDRDYHTQEQVLKRYDEAAKYGVRLHIWHRKEIENYLIIPQTIQRVISNGCADTPKAPSLNEVEAKINEIAQSLYEEIFDNLCTEYSTNKALAGGTASKRAREIMKQAWVTFEGRLSIIPGKQVLSLLSKWSQSNFCVSFSPTKIAHSVYLEEIPAELRRVIEAIENRAEMPVPITN